MQPAKGQTGMWVAALMRSCVWLAGEERPRLDHGGVVISVVGWLGVPTAVQEVGCRSARVEDGSREEMMKID